MTEASLFGLYFRSIANTSYLLLYVVGISPLLVRTRAVHTICVRALDARIQGFSMKIRGRGMQTTVKNRARSSRISACVSPTSDVHRRCVRSSFWPILYYMVARLAHARIFYENAMHLGIYAYEHREYELPQRFHTAEKFMTVVAPATAING